MELALPDGRIVNIYVDGPAEGTPLISHHGTPGAGVPMPSFVRAAAERGLRWVSYSRPGYGESTRAEGRTVADCVRDVSAIADHLGADRFFTSGGSGGGPHTLACAALLPDRVRGCAAIACPAPWGAEGLDWLAGQGPENLEEFAAVLEGPEALETYLEREAPGLSAAKEPQELIDAVGAGLLPDVDRAAITGEYATALIASMNRSVKNGIWGWFDDDMAFFRDWGFLLEDQGHLSLAVASFPQILDDLLEHAHP
ncbi:MAG: alpha/beta hydrolase [Actinobacteria bacterium]|nr:MAG: alpha/beta hydrolase [Actinomycetota bacterium]